MLDIPHCIVLYCIVLFLCEIYRSCICHICSSYASLLTYQWQLGLNHMHLFTLISYLLSICNLFEHIICIPKTHTEEVGITQPIISEDNGVFPSCIGYSKKMKRRTHKQTIKEKNNDDATIICSHTTVDGWRVLRFYKRVGCGKS